MGHQSYVLLCTEITLSNPPVVQPKCSCDVHLLRSPWISYLCPPKSWHNNSFLGNVRPGSYQNRERTQSYIRSINAETWRIGSNSENNRIITRELTNLEIAPPPSYEESIKENRAVHMNSCSSLPTYEESLELVWCR